MATEGILDNLYDDFIATKMLNGDRRNPNRAKMIVEIASQLSLGIGSTPFSDAAANVGINWRGGRPGDTSAMIFSVGPRTVYDQQQNDM